MKRSETGKGSEKVRGLGGQCFIPPKMLKNRIPQVWRIPQYRNSRLKLPKYRKKNCPTPQYRKPQCPPTFKWLPMFDQGQTCSSNILLQEQMCDRLATSARKASPSGKKQPIRNQICTTLLHNFSGNTQN